jgi:RNA polymerase sigma-70 factor (ECF subfamily)
MKKRTRTEEQALLADIRMGNEQVLEALYREFRGPFLRWAMHRHALEEEEICEAYQKAFTAFYFNVKDGKLTELTSSLQTYVFGIGKRVLYEFFKVRGKEWERLENVSQVEQLDLGYLQGEERSHLAAVVDGLLDQIDTTCREVLHLYYFQNFSMDSIANHLSYKNAAVAKKKKYSCLQKLKQLLESKGISQDSLLT